LLEASPHPTPRGQKTPPIYGNRYTLRCALSVLGKSVSPLAGWTPLSCPRGTVILSDAKHAMHKDALKIGPALFGHTGLATLSDHEPFG
jgi:hypothetical protein